MEDSKNYRCRNFKFVLYPDDPSHVAALSKIRDYTFYAYILHDKDTFDVDTVVNGITYRAGDLKKPHYHVVVKFPDARWASSVCSELGISFNYVRKSESLTRDLRYLIHYSDPDKYQYSFEEVAGTLKDQLWKTIVHSGTLEEDRAMSIKRIIDGYGYYLELSTLFELVCSEGLYADFRRGYALYKSLLKEHNAKYYDRLPKNEE